MDSVLRSIYESCLNMEKLANNEPDSSPPIPDMNSKIPVREPAVSKPLPPPKNGPNEFIDFPELPATPTIPFMEKMQETSADLDKARQMSAWENLTSSGAQKAVAGATRPGWLKRNQNWVIPAGLIGGGALLARMLMGNRRRRRRDDDD